MFTPPVWEATPELVAVLKEIAMFRLVKWIAAPAVLLAASLSGGSQEAQAQGYGFSFYSGGGYPSYYGSSYGYRSYYGSPYSSFYGGYNSFYGAPGFIGVPVRPYYGHHHHHHHCR